MKKATKVQQVAEVLANNPNISIKALAKKFNTTITYAYVLRSQARSSLKQPEKLTEFKTQDHNIIQGYTGKQYELIDFTPPPIPQVTDAVNHPPHYKTGGIETIDFIEAKTLNYHLGNVVKYVSRASHKGHYLQDLEKAQWYLTREIEKVKNESGR